MVEIPAAFKEAVNTPGRIGVLATADTEGKPNIAYFGSPRLAEDGTFMAALTENRTLKNLTVNPHAVFFCVTEGPVSFQTPGCRLYLKLKALHRDGPVLEDFRKVIAERVGPQAAAGLKAAVVFDVTETRALVDMG